MSTKPPPDGRPGRPKKLLIVDDEPHNLAVLTRAFRKAFGESPTYMVDPRGLTGNHDSETRAEKEEGLGALTSSRDQDLVDPGPGSPEDALLPGGDVEGDPELRPGGGLGPESGGLGGLV